MSLNLIFMSSTRPLARPCSIEARIAAGRVTVRRRSSGHQRSIRHRISETECLSGHRSQLEGFASWSAAFAATDDRMASYLGVRGRDLHSRLRIV